MNGAILCDMLLRVVAVPLDEQIELHGHWKVEGSELVKDEFVALLSRGSTEEVKQDRGACIGFDLTNTESEVK